MPSIMLKLSFLSDKLKEDAESYAQRIYLTLIFLIEHSLLPGLLARGGIFVKLWQS